jgi:hypothetical protein
MVKMADLRRTKADVAEEKKALGAQRKGDVSTPYVPPEDEGARMEFEHHHLEKMGVGGDLKSGDTVHFKGHGTVERSESRSSPDGDRHSATIRFHHGSVDHEPQDSGDDRAKSGIRGDLESAAAKSAEKASIKVSAGSQKVAEK